MGLPHAQRRLAVPIAVQLSVVPVGERRLLQPGELWPQEHQLCAMAVEGGLVDLRCRRPRQDDPVRGQGWDRSRWVRAQVLFQLLTGHGPQLADSVVTVRLRGARIVGRLNLGCWKLRCPLELFECYLRYRLDLAKAEAANINLRGSYLRSRLSARRLRVAHPLNLSSGFRCDGALVLRDAHIGELMCSEAIFARAGDKALCANGLVVDAQMSLRKVQCTGEIRLADARINGQLDCMEATFTNPEGQALNADRLIATDMLLNKVRCTGEVRLLGTHITGMLACLEAIFTNPQSWALNADGLTVEASMFLNKAQCTGEVVLSRAHITDELDCTEATFTNPDGTALTAYGLTVDAGMFLRNAECTGEVSMHGAHIGGPLHCVEAVFNNPNGKALTAEGLTVDAGMFVRKAECIGEMSLPSAHIKAWLDWTAATVTRGVNLQAAFVGGAVQMCPAVLAGDLNLRHARVGAWYDEMRTWPGRQQPPAGLELDGFVYETIGSPDATVNDRLRWWLPRNSFSPQPYEQLAAVYRRRGDEASARAVAIGKQQAVRADIQGWARWPNVVWSALLRWTIGYGYRPARALIPWLVLLIVGSVLFQLVSDDPTLLHPVKTGPEQPSFNAFRYTVDLLLPVANFNQRDSFVASGWVAWVSFGFIFAGWLLAAIVAAGLTGVFKRD